MPGPRWPKGNSAPTQARYQAVDAVHLGDFEEESKREDAGLSTAPLV